MLSRFSNEVLIHGPHAILPQNLPDTWLKELQQRCDDFLDTNFAVDQCTEDLEMGDPLLIACVHEALRHDHRNSGKQKADELAEKATIFALSVTMESIRRETDMAMDLPTLDNLLSLDRIVQFSRSNPQFGRFLERACIISEDSLDEDASWFQRLKSKIFSRLTAS